MKTMNVWLNFTVKITNDDFDNLRETDDTPIMDKISDWFLATDYRIPEPCNLGLTLSRDQRRVMKNQANYETMHFEEEVDG